ncbi:MAG: hypothetical protein V7709_20590 [Halioglobus sp.]
MAACILLSACSYYSYDLGERLSRIQIPDPSEQLDRGEILRNLGPPQRISATTSGYVMAWEHWDISETKVGFSLGFAGAEALSVDMGKSRVQGEFLLLGFNDEHQLTDSAFTKWDDSAGGGRAIQPFGGLVSVVDVDDLLEDMPQHEWGAGSLAKLPVTLNTDNRPDMGQNGIEQRGTPTAVGQRALEMN